MWARRSELDLLGAHINLRTGAWTQADSGIGRGIDSFFEYMLKAHMLFGGSEYLAVFHDSYHAALRHLKHGSWYIDAHMANGQVKCFARSLKPTDAHKVTGLAEAVPRAFPGASSLIIDAEVVMKDAGGSILAFGAQGKHEQQKYAAAIVRNSAQFSAII